MVSDEKLTKLYNEIIYSEELTTKKLKELGFNSKDINELISQNIITRIKRGFYALESVEKLFQYGKSIVSKSYDLAIACFKKCFELDSNHKGVCFQLFIYSINNKDYDSAFKYFDVLLTSENKYYIADCKFYLYLLSIITHLPEKYKEYIKDLTIDDIAVNVNDKRYKKRFVHNKIRFFALQRKLAYAMECLKDINGRNQPLTLQELIIKKLLLQAIIKEKQSRHIILEFGKNKEYQRIAEYLNEKYARCKLSIAEQYILKLVNKILYYMEHIEVPDSSNITTAEDIFEAIDEENYELALSLSTKHNQLKNVNDSKNIINILLTDLCEIIKQNSNQITNNEISKDTIGVSSDKIPFDEKGMPVTLVDIINHLMYGNWDDAYKDVELYLEQINKKEYLFLIINLIKICILENDMTFIRPLKILSAIYLDDFNYNIDDYISVFYFILAENNEEKVKLYKEIILKLAELTKNYQLPFRFLQSLNYLEKTDNNLFQKENNEEKIQGSNILEQELENLKDFVDQQCQKLLEQKGVILLGPMEKTKRKIIRELAKKYNDIISFTIGEAPNKYVVLRYKPIKKDFPFINPRELLNLANTAYNKADYKSSIKYFLQILQFGNPYAVVYKKIGLSYLCLNNVSKAIEYLTVAEEVGKEQGVSFNLTNFIDELKANVPKDERKKYIKMREKDFYQDDFSIINFDEINNYILETGLDIESACENFGLTNEQIDIVRLLYAKTYYMQGFGAKGDEFLNFVERNQNKSPYVISLLGEIKSNKKLYLAKRGVERPISLTLKPIKK